MTFPAKPKVTLWDAVTGRKVRRVLRPEMRVMECGNCHRAWDDARITSVTPAPSARCPFESTHRVRKTRRAYG